jgi:hypothetical protein
MKTEPEVRSDSVCVRRLVGQVCMQRLRAAGSLTVGKEKRAGVVETVDRTLGKPTCLELVCDGRRGIWVVQAASKT